MKRSKDTKKYTLLAVKLSGPEDFKPIGDRIVYLPSRVMLNTESGKFVSVTLHICNPSKLVQMLAEQASKAYIDEIWRNHCGVLFRSKKLMFCSKCFEEFDESLAAKIAIIDTAKAGSLTL